MSEKYKNMAQTISDQVNYNEETSEILSISDNGKKIKKSVDDIFFSKNE